MAFPDSGIPFTPMAIRALLAALTCSTERLVSAILKVAFLKLVIFKNSSAVPL